MVLWSAGSNAGPASGTKSLNAPTNPIETGRPFIYQLDARCPGSISPQDDCLDYRVTDTLPANLQATALPAPGGLLEKVCLGANPDRATCAHITALPTPAGATLTFFLRGGTCPNTAVPAPGGRVCAGAQQSLDFSAQFVPGTTTDNATAVNPATFTSTDNSGSPTTNTPVSAAPITSTASDKATLSKTVTLAGAAGSESRYRVTACPSPPGALGYLLPASVTITDDLPAGATYIAATPTPNSTAGGALTWNGVDLSAGCRDFDIRVAFPTPGNSVGDDKNNRVAMTYTPAGESTPKTLTSTAQHTLAAPTARYGSTKSQSDPDNNGNVGQFLSYRLSCTASGNVPLNECRVEDELPPNFEFSGLNIGALPAGTTASIGYQRATNGSATCPAGLPLSGTPANTGGEYVCRIGIAWTPLDAQASVAASIGGNVCNGSAGANPCVSGADVALPFAMTNTANHTALDWSGAPIAPQTHATTFTIRDPATNRTFAPQIVKTLSPAGTEIPPSGNLSFTLAMSNSGTYSSPPEQVALLDPVFADLLPAGVALNPPITVPTDNPPAVVAAGAPPANCAQNPTVRAIPDYNGTGRIMVVFDWSGTGCSLARNNARQYTINARIAPNTAPATLTNRGTFLGSGNPPTDKLGIDSCNRTLSADNPVSRAGSPNYPAGIGDSARVCQTGSVQVAVAGQRSVESRKGVLGQLDAGFGYGTQDFIGRTVQGGTVTWRLEITNTGNIGVRSVDIIDILPFSAADGGSSGSNRGVGTNAPLGTTWSPRFAKGLVPDVRLRPSGAVLSGGRVYYTNAPNPCRSAGADPDIVNPLPGNAGAGACNPMAILADGVPLTSPSATPAPGATAQWSTVLPADAGLINAFRVQLEPADVIPPGQTLQLDFLMWAPFSAPIDTCSAGAIPRNPDCTQVAWNTFGFQFQYVDRNITGTAPTRVGVVVKPQPANTATYGNYVWFDTNQNGINDEAPSNGINNALVELYYDADGDPATTGDQSQAYVQRTGPNPEPGPDQGRPGYYLFAGLPPSTGPGRYFTRFYPPDAAVDGAPGSTDASAWRATLPNAGGNDATDSDGVPSPRPGGSFTTTNGDGSIGMERRGFVDSGGVPLAAGQNFRDADQGFYRAVPGYSLGNRLWYDTDNDGIDNDGAGATPGSGTGIANVTVELWEVDAGGNPTGAAPRATTATNATGHYLFTDLPAGNYRAVIPPTQFAAAGPLNGLLSSGTVLAPAGASDAETGPVGSSSSAGAVDGNSDQDGDDHGARLAAPVGAIATGSVASGVVTLGGTPAEPVNEINSNAATGPAAPSGKTDGIDDPTPDDHSNLSIDFGFYSMSVGNLVWRDDGAGGGTAADGIRQPGEPGIPGVTVRLLAADGTVIATTQTDATGRYLFAGLAAGYYQVEIDQGPGSPILANQLNPTTQPATAGTPLAADNDNNGVNISATAVRSAVFALTPGAAPAGESDQSESGGAVGGSRGAGFGNPVAQENRATPDGNSTLAVDFGFTQQVAVPTALGAIGNYVWLDENSDGRQDPGERGIANVTVTLTGTDGSGNPVNRTTTTDANGGYLFTGLPAGTYQVQVSAATLPAGLTQTTANPVGAGADFGNQSQPYAITLGTGETNLTADFGYNYNPEANVNGNTGNAALGDRVWIDANGDGRQDPGEPGVAGVTVNLFGDPDGNGVYDTPAGTATTDASGNYIFSNLPPGPYVVVVDASTGPLAGYTQTGDPDHFGTTGANDSRTTAPVVLGPGDVFLNTDFGYQPPAVQNNSVGDTVWFDADANGAQDAGEPGVPGVTVALYRDSNGNGQLDAGEPAIATTTTDAGGRYLFAGVPDGNYIVRVTDTDNALGGLVQSGDPDSVLDGRGAVDLDSASANPAPVQNLDQDFGYTARSQQPGLGLIGATVFLDGNGNGQPDSGEGIGGVTVQLYDATGTTLLATTTTDGNGHYSFGGLDPNGIYTVRVDTTTLPPGVTDTVDPDGGTPSESVVTLTPANPVNLNQDFGYRWVQVQGQPVLGSIGNQLWLDRNADGVYAPDGSDGVAGTGDDEPGIAGVTVDLYFDTDGNGHIDPGEPRIGTATTDGAGQYLFPGLLADNASYVVQVSDRNGVLDGYAHSVGSSAGDGATDNNSQAGPHPVTLAPGAPDYRLADFGYYPPGAAVGNRVWNDTNSNGIQDAGEPGMINVPVMLTIAYPGGATTTLVALTDANGFYSFGKLLLDEDYPSAGGPSGPAFTLSVATTPTGFSRSPIDVGSGATPDRNDSDNHAGVTVLPVRGLTDTALLADPNQEPDIASYDFGFIGSTVSLGDRIWSDANGNGVQDAGEPGIAAVRVFLDTNGNGALDAGEPSQITAGGNYTFTGLTPGTYRVVVDTATLLAGFAPTSDLDGVATPSVAVVTLSSGQARTDVDFGYRLPAASTIISISSTVWRDLDGDGERDQGESGIAGVTITLTDADGNAVATTTTDANGNYRFIGLPPGTYVVTYALPPGYAPSTNASYTVTAQASEAVADVSNFGLQPQESPPPTDIPALSDLAMLALLALLLLVSWRNIGQAGQRRTRG